VAAIVPADRLGMRILIATDAFPPVCGGSGWSTYELAKGLRARGHEVLVVRPRVGSSGNGPTEYDGFRPIEFAAWAPRVPFLRNYFKNERLYRGFERFLVHLARRHHVELIHAQHVLTGPPSILAGRSERIPVVCTVRDYWPVCYWADLIDTRTSDALCPGCSASHMTTCLKPRAGVLWPLAVPVIPYMRRNLALKRGTLARADVVVAVSGAMARDLKARARELGSTRIDIIHNPVDVAAMRAQADQAAPPRAGPYALFVGKLERNKGVSKLAIAIDRADLDWPLVVVGDGSERMRLQASLPRPGRDVQFTGWQSRDQVLAWIRHAAMLIFPSHGPESLSRVLLEASALGCPIAAMDTGGTRDIIEHGVTGLVSQSAEQLGDHVATLRRDERLRERLGAAARRRAESIFDAPVVVGRMEQLYRELIQSAPSGRRNPEPGAA
jgi:glycosyltransferase involved in cell wall biosynthesis